MEISLCQTIDFDESYRFLFPGRRSCKRAAIQQDQAEDRGFESHQSRIFSGRKFSRLSRA